DIAKAAEAGGADMISATNTCYGLAVDWRRRRPRLGNGCGGFSGPAIKPISLRCVWQIAQAVKLPIIGIGGISTVDDVFDFLVAGASAVEIGTANFYEPDVTTRILDALPVEMEKAGIKNIADIIGTLEM
ncbi:MAG: nitronate monooxygenase, partial [Thermoguttaceae bacterium]|nr:nitronate monooxygenase [Thermoguttaceae bacterium]